MISVIVPVYNREKTIQDSLKSILNQSCQDFEIIVVDDCSVDNTKEKILELQDSRIHYYRMEKNSGAGGARNEGLRRAKGDYIAFHDSDDVMRKDKLAIDLHFLMDNDYDGVYSQLERFDLNGTSIGIQPVNCHNCDSIETTYRYFLWEGRVWTQTLFAKRYCFEEIQFDEAMRCNEDWEISLRLAQKFRIGFLEKPLTDVYIQSNSISIDEEKALWSYQYLFQKYNADICCDSEMEKHWRIRILYTKWTLNKAKRVECMKAFWKTKDYKWIVRALFNTKEIIFLKKRLLKL